MDLYCHRLERERPPTGSSAQEISRVIHTAAQASSGAPSWPSPPELCHGGAVGNPFAPARLRYGTPAAHSHSRLSRRRLRVGSRDVSSAKGLDDQVSWVRDRRL